MAKKARVLGMGDQVCDKYRHSGTMYPGGQALNFAVFAARLGCEAHFLGVFGDDGVGAHVKATLETLGVPYPHAATLPGENGYAVVDLVDGDRVFIGSNKCGVLRQQPLSLTGERADYVAGFDLVHTSNNSYADHLLSELAARGVTVSYDLSGDWTDQARLQAVCPYVRFAFLSCPQLGDRETEDRLRAIHSLGCAYPTATRGALGALLYDGQRFHHQPPDYVKPVDTLGAGDGYAAAFLVALLDSGGVGGPIAPERLEAAMAAGAAFSREVCLSRGAFGYGVPYTTNIAE